MKTRTVVKTDRTQIDRISDRYYAEYVLYLDNAYYSSYPTLNDAEHEAAVWLAEQAQRLAVFEVAA
jgi:hypothetical protein